MLNSKLIYANKNKRAQQVGKLSQHLSKAHQILVALQAPHRARSDEHDRELRKHRELLEGVLRDEVAEVAAAFGFSLGGSFWEEQREEREKVEKLKEKKGVSSHGMLHQDPGFAYCTCLPSKGKSDCPVGTRVGNHPIASKVCKDTNELIGGRKDIPHPDLVRSLFPVMGELKEAAQAALEDENLEARTGLGSITDKKLKRLKKATQRASDWLIERLFDDTEKSRKKPLRFW